MDQKPQPVSVLPVAVKKPSQLLKKLWPALLVLSPLAAAHQSRTSSSRRLMPFVQSQQQRPAAMEVETAASKKQVFSAFSNSKARQQTKSISPVAEQAATMAFLQQQGWLTPGDTQVAVLSGNQSLARKEFAADADWDAVAAALSNPGPKQYVTLDCPINNVKKLYLVNSTASGSAFGGQIGCRSKPTSVFEIFNTPAIAGPVNAGQIPQACKDWFNSSACQGASDSTAPVFENSTPSISAITSSSFQINADINEAGTVYYVVVPTFTAQPSVAQVKAGQDSSGSPAVKSGSQALASGSFAYTFDVTGLSEETTFDVYMVAQDDEGTPNVSAVTAKVSATTLANNAAPVITNLNGDSVAWPGVGNTVTLDAGGNATVADTELDAANWDGASLTVQRNVGGTNTPISSDLFSFISSGYTVSGSNLQTGATTFGTFINTNGVLTINFNSNATNTLVRDVMRGIQYRNDTPAGDATIRFALSDGTASTTADVAVTSDTIYVTDTIDTAIIDPSDGVSFSEAIGIAAADVIGSQTIVFNSTLAATALTVNSVSLNESLTFDMDAANGMSLTSGTITFGAATTQTFTNGSSDTAAITGVIAGSGALEKSGAGTLTLAGANTFTGNVSLAAGGLTLSGGATVGDSSALSLSADTTLTLSSSETIGSLVGTGTVSLGATLTSGGNNSSTTFSGTITGSGGLTKTGTGTLILNSSTNDYTGATTLSAGAITVMGSNAIGDGSAVTMASGATLTVANTGSETIGSLAGSGTVVLNQALRVGGDNSSTTYSGLISSVGNNGIAKSGSGTFTLSGSNTYTGSTSVSAGSLSIASDANLGSGTLVLNGGTLAVTGSTTIDNAIALGGDATVSNSANVTLSGVISGANTLTKSGASTLTLSNTNTYSGTTVSSGILSVAGDNNLGSGAITLADGTRLNITAATTIDNAIIILSGVATIFNDPGIAAVTLSGVISGSGGLTKGGRATLALSASNTYTGATLVSTGTLIVGHNNALGATAGTTTVNGVGTNGASLRLSDGVTTAENFVIAGTGGPGNNGTLRVISGSATITGTVTLTAESYIRVDPGTSLTVSGVVSGAFNLRSMGTGTLTLSGDNTYSGGTTLARSNLSVASGSNLGTGAVTLLDGSTLMVTGATTIANAIALNSTGINDTHTVNNANAVTLSGNITGTLPLTKAGGGILTLSGTNTYSNTTTVSVGTLSVTGSTAGATNVASGATLGGTGTLGGTVTVQNGGTLAPGNSAGTLTLNGNLTMASGSTLAVEINGATAGTEYDQILVNGTVNVSGATLSATHNYTAGQGDSYTIIVNDQADAITGTFSTLAEGGTTTAGGNGTVMTASYIGSDGNDFTLTAPINAAPVIANLNGDSVSFIEDSDLTLLDASSDATVTDSDSVDFDGGNVTVSIVANRVNSEDVLSIQNQGTAGGQIGTSGLNITYGGTLIGARTVDGGTDINDLVITLNSAATPAIIQALVRNLTYTNTNTTTPDTGARTVRVTVYDGDGGTSSSADIAVAVVATNDAPTLTATGATPTFTEGGAAVGLFSGTSVSTVESGQLITMLTVTVTNVTEGSDEIIYFDGSDIPLVNGFTGTSLIHSVDISVALTGSTATLTLVRTGGLSSAQTLVDGMAYRNNSLTPTVANRVITITALRDNGGTANGGVDTSNPNVSAIVTIVAVNSVPVATTSAGVTAFTEGNNVASTPVVIDSGITVSDLDNATLASATVSITANFQAAEDVLAFTNDGSTMGNISASYDSGTGVLSLVSSGATATLAEWELALAAVTYTNSSEAPSEATREISFAVSDGVDTSVVSTKSVSVTAVDNTPIISGAPSLSVNQGAAYSFTPSVSDSDSVVLLFSIANQPAWATFDPITGTLSGTPTNAHVGTTAGIVITVSDGTTSTSLPAFNVTVINVNDAPVISGAPATSVNQDVAYSFIPTASDVDVGDVLTFSITNQPTWASFNPATGALTGTPTNADVGVTTGIVISVSDGTLSASLPAFNVTVVNVNDAPVITGTPATSVDQDVAYSFTPTATDADVGDTLTFSITNKPTWASFNTATGALTGTPAGTDSGKTIGIVISVSDGTTSTALPAFDIEIISTIDPLQPIVTAPAELNVDATALFTPITLRQLLGAAANATDADVNAALKALAKDGVSGNDCCTTTVEGLTATNALLLAPGRHELKWKAINAVGVSGEAVQVVNIRPLVSLSPSQIAIRGSDVEFKVLLNGPSPVYPLAIPYVIDAATTATAAEHNLTSGTATFTQTGQVEVVIPVALADLTGFSDSQLVVALGSGINSGAVKTHVVDIRSGNVPPVVSLSITQGGINTSLVSPTGGSVTVTATVVDANKADTHTFDWSATSGLADTDGDPANASRTFDPTGLTGSHQLNVTVADSAGASVRSSAYFRVVGSLPVLDINTDTDLDGINDALEGTGDRDDNGIPDYLDNMPSSNVLPQQGNTTNAFLIECEPGVRCGLGLFARSGGSGGVQILDQEIGTLDDLIIDPAFEPVGGVFDFAVRDLPTPGQSVRIAIPQRSAIPANAVYRKYQRGRWVNFISDTNNAVHSTAGSPGYCPPPGAAEWTPGLTAGHMCVQLTIEDGGPNDDDGLVNSAVVDPGAVSQAKAVEPPEPKPPKEVKTSGGGGAAGAWLLLGLGLLSLRRVRRA